MYVCVCVCVYIYKHPLFTFTLAFILIMITKTIYFPYLEFTTYTKNDIGLLLF
jgi:hypothetical protein